MNHTILFVVSSVEGAHTHHYSSEFKKAPNPGQAQVGTHLMHQSMGEGDDGQPWDSDERHFSTLEILILYHGYV